jgi:hypothetical protein
MRRMRWIRLVELMGLIGNADKISIRKPEGRNHSGDLVTTKRIILKQILVCDVMEWIHVLHVTNH